MYCLDDNQELKIKGLGSGSVDFSLLKIEFLPCTLKSNADCNHTLKETQDYMKSPRMIWLMNEQSFDLSNFTNPIVNQSTILN